MCFSAASAAMLSACDRAVGAEPRPLIAVHVDFDMALLSERGRRTGSRLGARAWQRCSHLELNRDLRIQEASKKF